MSRFTRLVSIDASLRELAGRCYGYCDGSNDRERRALEAERAEIARADPLIAAAVKVKSCVDALRDGGPAAPGRPDRGLTRYESLAELCAEPNPSAQWLRERELSRAEIAETAAMLAKAALELATIAGDALPLAEKLRLSIVAEGGVVPTLAAE